VDTSISKSRERWFAAKVSGRPAMSPTEAPALAPYQHQRDISMNAVLREKIKRASALYKFKMARYERWGWRADLFRNIALSAAAAKYGLDVNILREKLSENAGR